MSRLSERFATLRKDNRRALIPYLTAGDPSPAATVEFMHALVEAGADVLEVGVPFSDPMADGPVIQAACERALAAGTSLQTVLDLVAAFREHDTRTPVVLMGYLNPIDAMGLECFAGRAATAGVDAVLIVDLAAEEGPEVVPTLRNAGIESVCLVAPTTGDARIARICEHAGGFIYYVSFKGVTGAASLDTTHLADEVRRVRAHTDLPVAVGFGVRTPQNAADVSQSADAVVVGSALVRLVAAHGNDIEATKRDLRDTLTAMRGAMDDTLSNRQEADRA